MGFLFFSFSPCYLSSLTGVCWLSLVSSFLYFTFTPILPFLLVYFYFLHSLLLDSFSFLVFSWSLVCRHQAYLLAYFGVYIDTGSNTTVLRETGTQREADHGLFLARWKDFNLLPVGECAIGNDAAKGNRRGI